VYGLLPLETAAEPPLLTFDEESRVIYITSFSKVLAPALRIGALIASPSVLPALAAAKQSSDLVCSTVIQRALAEYLRRGHMGPHLEQVRRVYRERRDVMLAALERHLPECAWTLPRGGLCLWVTLPDAVSERDFVRDALDAGVGVAPGGVFHAGRPRGSHVRLSFSMQPPERIERGVEILGAVLQAHLGRRLPRPALAAGGVGPMV
jgi:2-aminoadipate transaminase